MSVALLKAWGADSMSTPAGRPAATATVALETEIWLAMSAEEVPVIVGLSGLEIRTLAAALVRAVTPKLGATPAELALGTEGTMAKSVSLAPKASRPKVFSL